MRVLQRLGEHDNGYAGMLHACYASFHSMASYLIAAACSIVLANSSTLINQLSQYRDGFVVDDGPYRRLDDPSNADFLRSLASGRTPRELQGEGDVVVGLIDKRKEEYKEEFRSFSGQGASLGTRAASAGDSGVLSADELADAPAPAAVDEGQPATQIQVRLLNGQRLVIRTNLNASVSELAARIVHAAVGTSNEITGRFRLVAGFPPKPLADASVTVEEAGLKGAQVSLQKAD
jgi:UBX domain-containing protein 1